MTNLKLFAAVSCILLIACGSSYTQEAEKKPMKEYEVQLSEDEWRKKLSAEEFRILREKGTEYAFSGEYNNFKGHGVYACAGCGNELFASDHKFDSGSGWPSYFKPLKKEGAVEEKSDRSHGMVRTEVLCAKCGGHLGHVFPDGPRPTGLRYCINSASLDFQQKPKEKDE